MAARIGTKIIDLRTIIFFILLRHQLFSSPFPHPFSELLMGPPLASARKLQFSYRRTQETTRAQGHHLGTPRRPFWLKAAPTPSKEAPRLRAPIWQSFSQIRDPAAAILAQGRPDPFKRSALSTGSILAKLQPNERPRGGHFGSKPPRPLQKKRLVHGPQGRKPYLVALALFDASGEKLFF